MSRIDLRTIPAEGMGAILTAAECDALVAAAYRLGYARAALSLELDPERVQDAIAADRHLAGRLDRAAAFRAQRIEDDLAARFEDESTPGRDAIGLGKMLVKAARDPKRMPLADAASGDEQTITEQTTTEQTRDLRASCFGQPVALAGSLAEESDEDAPSPLADPYRGIREGLAAWAADETDRVLFDEPPSRDPPD